MRSLLTTFAFLLPFQGLKIRILNRLGHQVHPTCRLGMSLVRNVGRFELAEGATIGHFNVFGALNLVKMGRGSRITHRNMVMSGVTLDDDEPHEANRTLQLGRNSNIMSFHTLDCSGGLVLRDECWITGVRSTILSHAFDPDGGIIVEPVILENRAVIATSCTILAGVVVGEGALLAAGSTAWTRQKIAAGSLHGGVPARRLAPVKISEFVYNWKRYDG